MQQREWCIVSLFDFIISSLTSELREPGFRLAQTTVFTRGNSSLDFSLQVATVWHYQSRVGPVKVPFNEINESVWQVSRNRSNSSALLAASLSNRIQRERERESNERRREPKNGWPIMADFSRANASLVYRGQRFERDRHFCPRTARLDAISSSETTKERKKAAFSSPSLGIFIRTPAISAWHWRCEQQWLLFLTT